MGIILNSSRAYKKQTGFGKKQKSEVKFERKVFYKRSAKPEQKSSIPLWSSLLVPGSGQLMLGENKKGGLAFILGLPMLVLAGISHQLSKNSNQKNIQNAGKAIAGIAGVTYLIDLGASAIDAWMNTKTLNNKDS